MLYIKKLVLFKQIKKKRFIFYYNKRETKLKNYLFCKPKGFKNFFPSKKEKKKLNENNNKIRIKKKTFRISENVDPTVKENKQSKNNPNERIFEKILLYSPLLIFIPLLANFSKNKHNEITWNKFKKELLEKGRVDYLEVINKEIVRVYLRQYQMGESDDFVYIKQNNPDLEREKSEYNSNQIYYFTIGSIDGFERQLEQIQRQLNLTASDWISVSYISEINWLNVLISSPFIYFFLITWSLWFLSRRTSDFMRNNPMLGKGGPAGLNNIFSITKANVHVLNKGEKVNVKFVDVAGLQNAKKEVMEFVDFLKNPKIYTSLGAKIPKGALLVGPPGTGKTLLAKAVAGEANCPFFSISGSDFIEMFVGVGPSRVRDLFSQARKNAPCIVFIDEIDAVGRKRGKGGFGGGNDERENTLNQLLVEMDGFQSNSNIVILAGTNRQDILDNALMRPGRFDRQIVCDKPDIKGRIEIFKVHLKALKCKLNDVQIAQRMATLTPGFSGADIANICNEAALKAARDKKVAIEMEDFYYANDRVIGGIEKPMVMTNREKKTIAFHEAGHAVCGWFLEHAEPLLKVTIIPRGGGALGFAQYLPKELQLYTKDQIYDMLCMTLGGRASEQIFFKKISTGATDDLKKVTKLSYALFSVYGMGNAVGQLSFQQISEQGYQEYRQYSEKTAQLIDEECRALVDEVYQRTLNLVSEKKNLVEKLGKKLLKEEVLGHDELVKVLGERPFKNDFYKDYVKNNKEFSKNDQSIKESTLLKDRKKY